MFKRVVSMLMVLVMVMGMTLMTGCGTKEDAGDAGEKKAEDVNSKTKTGEEDGDSKADTAKKDGKFTLGCSVYYMTEFVTLMVEGMKEKAEELDNELVMLDAGNDAQKQITQIENLIAQKVDAIVVAAVDSDAILPAIEMCEEAGIPLIGVNMLFNTKEAYHYVGPDDVLAGELEMQNAIDKIGGKGNVVILEGPIGQSAQIQRLEGNENVLKKNPDINVLAQQPANWSREEALTLTENWLETFKGKINAIVAHNDEMALGAIQALEAAGLQDEIAVVGVDAILDGCNAVKDGTLLGTVYQDAGLEGKEAIKLAHDVLTGTVTEKKLDYIDMTWITKDNVEDLLKTIYAK